MTEFTVAVLRNQTEHKIKLQQVVKWAEPTMREGPAGTDGEIPASHRTFQVEACEEPDLSTLKEVRV